MGTSRPLGTVRGRVGGLGANRTALCTMNAVRSRDAGVVERRARRRSRRCRSTSCATASVRVVDGARVEEGPGVVRVPERRHLEVVSVRFERASPRSGPRRTTPGIGGHAAILEALAREERRRVAIGAPLRREQLHSRIIVGRHRVRVAARRRPRRDRRSRSACARTRRRLARTSRSSRVRSRPGNAARNSCDVPGDAAEVGHDVGERAVRAPAAESNGKWTWSSSDAARPSQNSRFAERDVPERRRVAAEHVRPGSTGTREETGALAHRSATARPSCPTPRCGTWRRPSARSTEHDRVVEEQPAERDLFRGRRVVRRVPERRETARLAHGSSRSSRARRALPSSRRWRPIDAPSTIRGRRRRRLRRRVRMQDAEDEQPRITGDKLAGM